MTFHLIHRGKGETAVQELPAFTDPTVAVPRQPQVLRRTHFERRQSPSYFEAIRASKRKPYSPGHLLELERDACRHIITDENSLRCGAKCLPGKSQCKRHDDFIHGRVSEVQA